MDPSRISEHAYGAGEKDPVDTLLKIVFGIVSAIGAMVGHDLNYDLDLNGERDK